MKNPRISPKERGLLKGAIRRIFSRSDLRRQVIARATIQHSDPKHPRVTKWCRCEACGKPVPAYLSQVDHKLPLVPLDSSLEEMSWDEVVNNCWCDEKHLQVLDKTCHTSKSKAEMKIRRENKKRRTSK